MEHAAQPQSPAIRKQERLCALHETTFALNIAAAIGYGLLVYAIKSLTAAARHSELGYYFFRAAIRIDDVLRLGIQTPVTTDTVAREMPTPWAQAGQELAVAISVCALAALLLLLVRLCRATRIYRPLVSWIAGLTAFFAVPMASIGASITADWRHAAHPTWDNLPLAILVAEALIAVILLFLPSLRPTAPPRLRLIVAIHHAVWVPVLWRERPAWIYPLMVFLFLLTAFVASGVMWVAFRGRTRQMSELSARKLGRWIVPGAVVSLAALLALWLPPVSYGNTEPRDLTSATLRLSRGLCYGMCPSYTVVIHGNGVVEYTGFHYVRVRGKQTGTINQQQMRNILQRLHDVNFINLDDRAFAWCFDTPSVAVTLSVDGKTKRVTSDAGCFGTRSGPQGRFVAATDEIDKIVGSDRWVKCNGHCRN